MDFCKFEMEELKKKLEHMNEVLLNAQRARFGQSSEKSSYVLDKDQLSLFNEAEAERDSKAEESTEETFTMATHTRKKKKTLDEKLADLPVEEILLEYYTCTYACDRCEKQTGSATIFSTQAPPPLMKRSLASPSTVADVMTK